MAVQQARKSLEPFLKDDVLFYEHQIEGIRRAIRMRNVLFADEMGLGKSLQALTVASADIARGWIETIIIICPVTLKTNWSEELDKFTRIPYMILGQQVSPKDPDKLISLGPAKRREQLVAFATMKGPRVLIVNYEQVTTHIHEFNSMKFDIAIFDEAHYLKNPKAKRTQACHKLSCHRYFGLTGTPMLNNANELWGILHLMDRARYPRYGYFVNRYCVFGGYEGKQIIGVKNEMELNKRLNEVMIRRYKKDVLDLPEVQIVPRKIDLNDEQQRLYDKVENELLSERVDDESDDEVENALTKLLRLKQICGTTFTFTGEDSSAKLDQAIEDAIEILKSGHKIVVFTQFRDVLEMFCRRLDKLAPEFDIWELHGDVKQHDRQKVVRDWSNKDSAGALCCMLQVAGVGLNMTASRHALFLDKLWTPGMNQQAIDRLHRIGQSDTQPVQVLEYLCRGTVETRVEAILRSKNKIFGTVVNDPDFKRQLLDLIKRKAAA